MRPSTLILVLLLGLVALPRDGLAEKVKANQETQLFARPGERAKVLLKVTEGKQMTVLAKEGRWLKVRVMGRTGYVARSTVDMPEGDEVARNTRRRSFVDGRGTKRGPGGQEAPDNRIGADAVGEGQEEKSPPPKKGSDDEDEDDEEDEPKTVAKKEPPKKEPPKKEPPKKEPPKKEPPKKGSDDDEDEDDENPVAAKSKPAPKQVATAKKGSDDDDEDEDEEDSRKRVKVSKKSSVYNEADTKSEVILVATADTPLFPTGEKKGKFTEVENDEGDLGYILTADISSGGEVKVTKKDEPEDEEEEEPAPRGKGQIDLRARAGVKLVSQALRSPGGVAMPPDNYNLSTSAAMIALGGGYYRPMGKKLVIGAELNYEFASAFGGIPVQMGAMKTTTTISMHNLNVRGILGLDFKKASGMMLLGRVGFQYYSYQVANASSMEKNLGRFPSEIIQSPTIGAALAMPRLTGKIGLRFSVDFIPLNISYKQTKFLEDGKSPSAKGAIVGAGLTYRMKSFDIQGGYDLTYTSATFGAKLDTSMRGHPMGGVKRTDTFHAVSVGIVKAF